MIDKILEHYDNFKVKQFSQLRFYYSQFQDIIKTFDNKKFSITIAGKSFEQRDIYLFKYGTGKTIILLWSQMHGNEPISTQGLIDFLNFLQYKEFSQLTQKFAETFTIFALPLLNPDGNEYFDRRNAQNIDINRDAQRQTTPEARLLWQTIKQTTPLWAFNLHDQERYYGTATSNQPTTLSFLAPAYDNQKSIDDKRLKSMLLIASIFNDLSVYLPKSIAKYNDTYMPTAFGDSVQKYGISTILFEAGFIIGDNQRQIVRKYYFSAILSAFLNLLTQNYEKFSIDDYLNIPFNIKINFVDFLLKNVKIKKNGNIFVTDIAIIKNILDNEKFTDLCDEYIIWDIGDLSNQKAFEIINCEKIIIEEPIKRLDNAQKILAKFI